MIQCLGCERVVTLSCIHLQIRADICTVLTADAVTTDKVSNYSDLAKLYVLCRGAAWPHFASQIILAWGVDRPMWGGNMKVS